MLIKKEFKPWRACYKDGKPGSGRPALENPYLDAPKALLVSTDGRMLSQLPVELEDGDVAGYVPVDAIKAAVKLAGKLPEARLDCTSADAVKLMDGRTWPRPKLQFPQYEQVIPKLDAARNRVARISFNPVLLAALFEAMGDPEAHGAVLTFEIDAEDDAGRGPVMVEAAGMSCVMMPMKLGTRAPNRLTLEAAHEVALGKDVNAADAERAAAEEVKPA